jgi:hypothetical protein
MIKIIASLAVAAGLIAGFVLWSSHERGVGDARTTARYELVIVALKTEATRVLGVETAKVTATTKTLNDFKHNQELQDATNQTTVAAYERRLRTAAGPAGRLRDPNAGAGCGNSGGGAPRPAATGPGDRANDPTQTGGLFSEAATGLLAELTKDADDINIAYASCRTDAINLRGVLK